MDIVDAQIHIGPGRIDEVEAAMDALGIGAVLVDEEWMWGLQQQPHYPLPGGFRPIGPTAQLAAMLKPERFSWLLRIKREDPEYAALIRMVRDAPHGRAIRIDPGMVAADTEAFGAGGFDHILAAACDAGLPLFAFAPDQPDNIRRALCGFPDLKFIIDHCGVFSNELRAMLMPGSAPLGEAEQLALFDRVLALAEYPNVALKWCHPSFMFAKPAWPGDGLWPILRRAISAFGADRIMWASDYTANQRGESWAEILYGLRADPDLNDEERRLILGGTARSWLNWPT
jgi:predicted TIM-barrel fold metal-dependent hydrolase